MNIKRLMSSILAFSLISSAVTSNTGFINKIIPINSITTSASYIKTSDGKWEFDINTDNTARIMNYVGSTGGHVIVPETVKDPQTNKSYTVTAIYRYAFYCNDKITSVTIPRGITEIQNHTFKNATNLTEVILPHSIKKIGESAFEGTKIQSISFPNNLESIERRAFKDTPLKSVTFNNGLKTIAMNAFENTLIESLSFPSSLTEIGSYAFSNTKISSITIPSNIKKIDDHAFKKCSNLKNVTINGDCTLGTSVFSDCNQITNINMNISTFESASKTAALGECPNLKTINNIQIVRYYYDGEPYFAPTYGDYIKQNYAKNDLNNVSFINDYIKGMLKYIVNKETSDCTNDVEKIKKLHDWVRNKVNYAYKEDGKTPNVCEETAIDSTVFISDRAICEGYARALTLLLREANFEAYYIDGDNHAWTMVKLGDYYFHIDACHDDVQNNYSHFLKSENEIIKCSSHDKWKIGTPVHYSRLSYTAPSKKPECKYSFGDANMDGFVNKDDDTYICNIILKKVPLLDKTLTDVNCDGDIDMCDAIAVHKLFIKA